MHATQQTFKKISKRLLLSILCVVHWVALSCESYDEEIFRRPTADEVSILKLPCDERRTKIAGDKSVGLFTVTLPGLLGNMMFAIAALEGIADSAQRIPHLAISSSCTSYGCGRRAEEAETSERRVKSFAAAFGFHLCELNATNISWHDYKGQWLGWGRFDKDMVTSEKADVKLLRGRASFSPRYFQHLGRHHFRRLFRFPSHVAEKARLFFEDARQRYLHQNPHVSGRQYVVGIHARRGDKNGEFHMFNAWSHDTGYIQRAKDLTHRLFKGNILFVVATDDHSWVQATMGSLPELVISPFVTSAACKMEINCHEPLIDMALLSLCDAVVVSGSSTFSWWSAYLSADTSVAIAPRLPINPEGYFGPCITNGSLPLSDADSQREASFWRDTAHKCGVPRQLAGAVQPNQRKDGQESLCAWLPWVDKHAKCHKYFSNDYYPDDWVLLDEDPSLDVYPDWWGPQVTSLSVSHKRAVGAETSVDGPGLAKDRLERSLEERGEEGGADSCQRVRSVVFVIHVANVPEGGAVCLYIDNLLSASLLAQGSGKALVEVMSIGHSNSNGSNSMQSNTDSMYSKSDGGSSKQKKHLSSGKQQVAAVCVGGEEGGCAAAMDLDAECSLSASSISFSFETNGSEGERMADLN